MKTMRKLLKQILNNMKCNLYILELYESEVYMNISGQNEVDFRQFISIPRNMF